MRINLQEKKRIIKFIEYLETDLSSTHPCDLHLDNLVYSGKMEWNISLEEMIDDRNVIFDQEKNDFKDQPEIVQNMVSFLNAAIKREISNGAIRKVQIINSKRQRLQDFVDNTELYLPHLKKEDLHLNNIKRNNWWLSLEEIESDLEKIMNQQTNKEPVDFEEYAPELQETIKMLSYIKRQLPGGQDKDRHEKIMDRYRR